MKKILIFLFTIIIIGIVGWGIVMNINKVNDEAAKKNAPTGWLSVNGSNLVDSNGDPIQLRGISSHGIQWFSDLYDHDGLQELRDEWGINVFRIAMYSDPNANGYVSNAALFDKVTELVDASIDLGIYVIIDWHILNDNDPNIYKEQAIEFFDKISALYGDKFNVIYEICNEPNSGTNWDQISQYANEVIPVIRKNAPNSVVIVGTPDWSKSLVPVMKRPLRYENIMYALHFYAGSHNKTLRDNIDSFVSRGLAVFVSECGITDASGDGPIYKEAFERWYDYMNEKKMSFVFWSWSNKSEGSSILRPDYIIYSGEIDENGQKVRQKMSDYLTETGEFIRELLLRYRLNS